MPMLRILGVCGIVRMNDAWLFEDMALLHDILPSADDELWLGAIMPVTLDPRALRVILPGARNMRFPWFTMVEARKLKNRFLLALRHMVEFTKTDGMLIVCINGHGFQDYGSEGAIEVGWRWIGHPRLLQCQEVLSIIKRCSGRTTLIINACFAGHWVERAVSLGLDSGRVAIVTSGGMEEIGDPVRVSRSSLRPVVANIRHDMALLRGEHLTPQAFGGNGGSVDVLRFFRTTGDELPMRFSHTAPPNPNEEFVWRAATGCFGLREKLPTAELARQYASLPFSPTAGCNTALSMQIIRWKNGELSWVEEIMLRRTLKRRLEAFRNMKDELRRRGAKIQTRQPVSHEDLYLWRQEASRFTVYESGFPWTQVRDLFISCMLQHQAANSGA